MISCDGAVYHFEENGHRYVVVQDQRVRHTQTEQIGVIEDIRDQSALVLWGINDNRKYHTWELLTNLTDPGWADYQRSEGSPGLGGVGEVRDPSEQTD